MSVLQGQTKKNFKKYLIRINSKKGRLPKCIGKYKIHSQICRCSLKYYLTLNLKNENG